MKKKGFTLIELLVVIAIIGILSSVVVVSLNSSRAKARDAKRIADMDGIQKALIMYFDSNNAYPAALTDLVSAGFIPSEPVGPTNGEKYEYAKGPSGLSYHLGTTLEQVTAGTGVLASDKDCNSQVENSCWTGAGVLEADGGFDGTAAAVYDLVP